MCALCARGRRSGSPAGSAAAGPACREARRGRPSSGLPGRGRAGGGARARAWRKEPMAGQPCSEGGPSRPEPPASPRGGPGAPGSPQGRRWRSAVVVWLQSSAVDWLCTWRLRRGPSPYVCLTPPPSFCSPSRCVCGDGLRGLGRGRSPGRPLSRVLKGPLQTGGGQNRAWGAGGRTLGRSQEGPTPPPRLTPGVAASPAPPGSASDLCPPRPG